MASCLSTISTPLAFFFFAFVRSVAREIVQVAAEGNTLQTDADATSVLQSHVSLAQVRKVRQRRRQRIPQQLILTGKWASVEEIPGAVGLNIKKTLALNPDLTVRWLSDSTCQSFLAQHYDAELLSIFAKEHRGSFRGDICRAAVLAKEGGFYSDLDVQWVRPMQDLVDEHTSFMSAYGEKKGELLNALMAAEPESLIMKATLERLRNWYTVKGDHQEGWMGPVTLFQGLQQVQQASCAGLDLSSHTLTKACGNQTMRIYEQRHLDCINQQGSDACPPSRASSSFDGLQFGLFEPGPSGRLVGWPRFAECDHWGCGGGGWTVANKDVQAA